MQNIYYINKQNVLTENIKKAVAEMNYNVRILSKEVDLLEEKIDKAIEYITSYESADTLMSYENKENNKGLDEKTMIEINRRYLIIHGKLLDILGDKE